VVIGLDGFHNCLPGIPAPDQHTELEQPEGEGDAQYLATARQSRDKPTAIRGTAIKSTMASIAEGQGREKMFRLHGLGMITT
jgi:hypothetical protein